MSYARIGEDGSDVYVWGDGELLHCEAEGVEYTCAAPMEMIEHLRFHERRGHTVPDKALERLWHEHWGLPYETSVERVIKAIRANPGAFFDKDGEPITDEGKVL